ncbi:hypothetical protein QL285_075956 [Trifolium repens]|nr:hypothetical protein QL285_075956 [Trifolium repens]
MLVLRIFCFHFPSPKICAESEKKSSNLVHRKGPPCPPLFAGDHNVPKATSRIFYPREKPWRKIAIRTTHIPRGCRPQLVCDPIIGIWIRGSRDRLFSGNIG